MSDTSEELHPLLIADLADEESCAILEQAASQRAVVVVPLTAAPVDRRVHLLEVYVAGGPTPRRFMVEPAGAPVAEGFPLRITPHGDPTPPAPWDDDDDDMPTIARPGAVRARDGQTSPSVSRGHTRDLDRRAAAEAMPSPIDDPHTGRTLANGKYRLDALVGAGGMGAVYRGHHRDLDKVVAVKLLHPTFQKEPGFSERFQAEALTMSRIDHPNVARVLDFGQEHDGLLYLVMEFLDGYDLGSVLEEAKRLDVERLARIMTQVCAALGHVHRHGIIHRDVKPTNILLVAGHDEEEDMPTEIAKVCDFGIALAAGRGGEGRAAGTPDYMSPEQCRGAELDARSDVYACGIILYELATGRVPFEGEAVEVMQQHIMAPPPPPSTLVRDLDPLLEAIILKALAKDPEQRQASMRLLRNELRELLAPVLLSAPSSETGVSLPPTSSGPLAPERRGTSTMPRRMSGGERWLGEDGSASDDAMFVSLGGLVQRDASYDEGDLLARDLARDGAWLNELAATMDGERFADKAKVLQIAVKKLLKDANADAIVPIVATLRRIIKEEREPTNPRVKWSGRVLRTLRDPPKLAPLVERALAAPEEPSRAVAHVLVETQAAGAEALVEGRKAQRGAAARTRFVILMRSIGAAALPPIRTALQEIVANGERSGPLVEDLLRAVPAVPDEAMGTLVATLLRGAPPTTAAAALVALASLWGERARPLLMGALGMVDTDVRIAALTGLRALKDLDAMVVRHVAPIVSGITPATEELRVAAAIALGEASPDARAEAANLLARAFARPTNPRAAPPAPLVVALARSLLSLNVPNAAVLVRDRAEASPDPLKRQLLTLIGR